MEKSAVQPFSGGDFRVATSMNGAPFVSKLLEVAVYIYTYLWWHI